MPKKTRKQKILSDQRKQITPASPFTFSYSANPTLNSPISGRDDITYIKQDLFKTVVIGGIFLVLEAGLYMFSARLGW